MTDDTMNPTQRHAVASEKALIEAQSRLRGVQNVMLALPTDAKARKNLPIFSGVLDYFPMAIAEIAKVSKQGNDQHNPGQPLHWARGKSSDHVDTIVRHLMERGRIDSDGQRHTAKAAWRVLALLQEEIEAEIGFKPERTE